MRPNMPHLAASLMQHVPDLTSNSSIPVEIDRLIANVR
jgi:hypothetical protein